MCDLTRTYFIDVNTISNGDRDGTVDRRSGSNFLKDFLKNETVISILRSLSPSKVH